MIIVVNKKTLQQDTEDYAYYIGRGPQTHMLTSGNVPMATYGWLGNPVMVTSSRGCPNCGGPHATNLQTLLCFATLFNMKLETDAAFSAAMEKLKTKWQEMHDRNVLLVCWCAPNFCHGDTLKKWAEGDDVPIAFTRVNQHYAWMSNMSNYPVFMHGILFQTAEHAYMWHKTEDFEEKRLIASASSPERAKHIGKTVKLRADWEEKKDKIMADVVMAKVRTNPDLVDRLLNTKNAPLYELTWWHDKYWGICSCERCSFNGKNRLGEIWMDIRTTLRQEKVT